MMPEGQEITGELDFGDVFSKTFDLYRRDFMKYLVLFAIVGAITGVLTTLVQRAFILPVTPINPTPQDTLNYLAVFLGVLIPLVFFIGLIGVVFSSVATGGAIKMAAGEIEKGQADLGASVRFVISKLVSVWVLSILVGIIVGAGLLALIVPGIILAIMFSLALPALLIEGTGISESLGRSRKLVAHRWLKSFALFLVFGIIILIASTIVSAVSGYFGWAHTIVDGILSAIYAPLIPIVLTVYYHSNAARIAAPQVSQAPMGSVGTVQAGMKFCPSCGTQMASWVTFCPKCGARQPA